MRADRLPPRFVPTGLLTLALAIGCNSVLGIEEAELDTPGEATITLCTDSCQWAGDGTCDDGGEGSAYSVCELGTDCADCGPRQVVAPNTGPVGSSCTSDTQCTELAGGFCWMGAICSAPCTAHADCGCAIGTTNLDVSQGSCGVACTYQPGESAGCSRVCSNDSSCEPDSFCDDWDWYGSCIPLRTMGGSCSRDAACAGIDGGRCLDGRICSATCSVHSDCGCAPGTTNGDVASGLCPVGCTGTTDTSAGACYAACSSDADCPGGTYCVLGTSFGYCIRDTGIGNPCRASYQCGTSAADLCLDEGLCSRSCALHADCGCPPGTTNDDILAGSCEYACTTPTGSETGYCRLVCSTDDDCLGEATCERGNPLSTCYGR